MKLKALGATVFVLHCVGVTAACAQAYPAKSIRFITVGADDIEGAPAYFRLRLGWHRALHIVQEAHQGAVFAIQQGGIAAHVDHRHQQAGNARFLERGGDGGIVVGERLRGRIEALTHAHSP